LIQLRSALLLLVFALLAPSPAAAERRNDGLDDLQMEALRDALRASDELAQAWFRLRAGDAAGARDDARVLARSNRKDADAWHLFGIAAAADGRPMESEQALRRSLRLRPDGWVAMHLVTNLVDRGRLLGAERILKRFDGALGTDLHFARARAWVLVARGELAEARTLLQALEERTGDATLAWQLSALLVEEGDARGALAAIRRAVAAAPEHPVYRRELFERLAAAGDWSGLVEVTSERGADAVGGGLAPYYKGMGLLRLGRTDEAVEAFSAVAEHGRAEPIPLAGATGYLLQLGAYAQAERTARVALDGQSEDAPLHHLLAMSLTRLEREGEALAHYRRASELSAGNADYRFDLLVSLCSLGRAGELDAALTRARRDFPEDARFEALAGRCGAAES